MGQRLAGCFVVVDQMDFAADKLCEPDGGAVTNAQFFAEETRLRSALSAIPTDEKPRLL